jgi:salicylate hydroxylase
MPTANREGTIRWAIIGGGIGGRHMRHCTEPSIIDDYAGLVAAIALRQQGVNVNVYKQSPSLKEIGAGVFIGLNARKLLERLGLEGELSAISPAFPPGILKVLQHWQPGQVTQKSITLRRMPCRRESCARSSWSHSKLSCQTLYFTAASVVEVSSRRMMKRM